MKSLPLSVLLNISSVAIIVMIVITQKTHAIHLWWSCSLSDGRRAVHIDSQQLRQPSIGLPVLNDTLLQLFSQLQQPVVHLVQRVQTGVVSEGLATADRLGQGSLLDLQTADCTVSWNALNPACAQVSGCTPLCNS